MRKRRLSLLKILSGLGKNEVGLTKPISHLISTATASQRRANAFL
jgi:hypothetical protein